MKKLPVVLALFTVLSVAPSPRSYAQFGNPFAAQEEQHKKVVGRLGEALNAKQSEMPKDVWKRVHEEYNRLLNMQPHNPEAQKSIDYLQWFIDLPWGKETQDRFDLAEAQKILDRDHYGLDQVKERVIEYLAVRKRTASQKGGILCFVGPKGTGKTSIAKAIAESMGRSFVRLSLGGVNNEAELRGFQRTYMGSRPGSIITQMKNAKTINPVMLMDEVDKLADGSHYGDPRAALLEILDPEQNNTFRDHYMDVPYDLSKVLFILTANDMRRIPPPLLDRVEIIEFSAYTVREKVGIAQHHIVGRKQRECGIKPGSCELTVAAIEQIIDGYTMEAGVRNLQENIGGVYRKAAAWEETKGLPIPKKIDHGQVKDYLGAPRYGHRIMEENGVGVGTGLAVSDNGGSTLNVEVLKVPGDGKVRTRELMEKMFQDSADNAVAYVKSKAVELGIDPEDFKKYDLEIAIAPAIPVDGPSAGTAMTTAIASSLSGRRIRKGVAMTGEVTLTGKVLPIGGLKQKVMAAERMGYDTVLFPAANEHELEEISPEVRKKMTLVPVKTMDEVLNLALEPRPQA